MVSYVANNAYVVRGDARSAALGLHGQDQHCPFMGRRLPSGFQVEAGSGRGAGEGRLQLRSVRVSMLAGAGERSSGTLNWLPTNSRQVISETRVMIIATSPSSFRPRN